MAYRSVDKEDAEWEFCKILNIVRGQSLMIKGKFDAANNMLVWENEEDGNDFDSFGIVTSHRAMPGVHQRNYRQVLKFNEGKRSCRWKRGYRRWYRKCENSPATQTYDEHFRMDIDRDDGSKLKFFHRGRSTLEKTSKRSIALLDSK